MIRDKIIKTFDQHVLRRSVLSLGDSEPIFAQCIKRLHCDDVVALEIGTYRGVSAAVLEGYCSHVYTIDLKRGRLEQLGERFDRQAFWSSVAFCAKDIDLRLVEDNAEKAALIKSLYFYFAFIDGAHDLDNVRFDFDCVKHCGAVLFHSYDPTVDPAKNGVSTFVDSLPKNEVTVMDRFAFWSPARG